MDAVYCASCPNVLLLKDRMNFPSLMAGDNGWQEYDKHLLPYFAEAEKTFPKCICGSTFKFMAVPKCPKCKGSLIAKSYDNKPSYRIQSYAFVSTGSIKLENGNFNKNT